MSSRVFDGDCTAVQLVPWRENSQSHTGAGQSPRNDTRNNRLAQGDAHQLEAAAAAALEQRVRESWQQGFDAGEAAARQTLESEVRVRVEKLAATIAEVAGLRSETIRRAEVDTVRLSIEIARRVLHRELSVDPSALEALIKAALEKLRQQEVHRVRVYPGEEKLMRSCLEQAGRGQAIEVIGDPSQSRGGVFFEISRGALDASVDTQLREIERGLTDELRIRT
ncbi:MAG: FliH/SctL family protein [Bryobacteraceae bacterium]